MIKNAMALCALLVVAPSAHAADALTGKDAAYIDWAARNCGMKSTPKEHGLIEAARAKGVAAFEKQYLQQFEDKSLTQALASPGQTRSKCEDIKSWYGASGSRIEGLVQNVSDATAPTPSSETKGAKSQSEGPKGGKRHK
jgi:hypothetical protein